VTTQASPPYRKVYPWVTPKIFADPASPDARAGEFFDHYADWFSRADEVVLTIASGNGDHILNYRGNRHHDDTFDWARYNCYGGPDSDPLAHNANWTSRVREGGERSFNPYMAGPMFIVSEAVLDYRVLASIYAAFRRAADERGIRLTLLEYLEPGPEFCASEWKTLRHPEAARGSADAGGTIARGLIDVCSSLDADPRHYASFPDGIPQGTATMDFIARQSAAFVRDLGLDGIQLGNQFGLLGLWDPRSAPEPTPERRAGVAAFFATMREHFGERKIYWQDSFWPADVEDRAWAMGEHSYSMLDGIICSTFAVLVERMNVRPNLRGKLDIARRAGGVEIAMAMDFVDPWYWYRIHLDDRRHFLFQHEVYSELGPECDGVMFFANDTFGHFIPRAPLNETLAVVARANGWAPIDNASENR